MWYDDEEVQRHLDQLLDRLCTIERMGGHGSTLVFISDDPGKPVLYAMDGKPFYPAENLTDFDVEIGVKIALKQRLPKLKINERSGAEP